MYHHCCQFAHAVVLKPGKGLSLIPSPQLYLCCCFVLPVTGPQSLHLFSENGWSAEQDVLSFFILDVRFLQPSQPACTNCKSYLTLKMVIKLAHYCYSIRYLPFMLCPTWWRCKKRSTSEGRAGLQLALGTTPQISDESVKSLPPAQRMELLVSQPALHSPAKDGKMLWIFTEVEVTLVVLYAGSFQKSFCTFTHNLKHREE